jgi:hypothetical protein
VAEAAVVARGCHGTTCAEPRHLEGREGTSISVRWCLDGWHQRGAGARRRWIETLASGGARHDRQRRMRANQSSGGVDPRVLVPYDQRRRPEWPGLAGARAGGDRGIGVEHKREEGDEVRVVGRFDRSVDRTDLVLLRPAGRPGRNGPARPNGLWPIYPVRFQPSPK